MGRRQRLVASVPVPSSVAHHRLSPSHRLLVVESQRVVYEGVS
jgi:hypothetical protein